MTSSRQPIVLLGSTGSIGTQALDIVRANRLRFDIRGLAAGGGNIELLARQVVEFDVPVVSVDRLVGGELRDAIHAIDSSAHPQIIEGADGATQVASLVPDGVVLNGITGGVGLLPTLVALKSGATLALANKESLVVGGHLVRSACVRPGQIVPVDSEHSAIAQALASGVHEVGLTSPVVTGRTEVADLVLTASGGPFRGKKRAELADITPEAALAHPTWNMGPVVTINSSTLMNKGLEVIEASRLFNVPPERIDVTVHPQSIVHSMVEFVDGATICQASPPDMRLPIALGLSAPDRMTNVAAACDWTQAATWTFEPLDDEAFPAVQLARHCLAASEKHTAVLNAANEQAVHAFLEHRLPYLGIVDTVKAVLDQMDAELRGNPLFTDVEEMNQLELEARRRADDLINKQ